MRQTLNRLTAVAVSGRNTPGYYCDGGGLYLRVANSGTKGWIYRFTMNGRTRDAGLGRYPVISLAEARAKADNCRRQVASGIDPIKARKAERAAAKREAERQMTFQECAQAYISSHESGWKNTKHRQQWASTLKTYAFPVIGALLVSEIDTDHVMQVLEPIWTPKPETASRLRGRIERILSWAKVRELRDGENPAQWRGHLDQLLPPKTKVRKVVHHAAMSYRDVPNFIAMLRAQNSLAARPLEFAILTASRTSEVLGARWDEFDIEAGLWTVPSERMKSGKRHRVPLSSRALEILQEMFQFQLNEYVFPGMKPGRPLSEMAMLMLLRRMGLDAYTVHGFRSSFRDWTAECTSYPQHVAELAISHTIPNAVEAAYRRGDLLDKRRLLMERWAEFTAQLNVTTHAELRQAPCENRKAQTQNP